MNDLISRQAAIDAEITLAERAAAERWSLSAREKNIVARLSGKPQIYIDEEIKEQMSIFDFGA